MLFVNPPSTICYPCQSVRKLKILTQQAQPIKSNFLLHKLQMKKRPLMIVSFTFYSDKFNYSRSISIFQIKLDFFHFCGVISQIRMTNVIILSNQLQRIPTYTPWGHCVKSDWSVNSSIIVVYDNCFLFFFHIIKFSKKISVQKSIKFWFHWQPLLTDVNALPAGC